FIGRNTGGEADWSNVLSNPGQAEIADVRFAIGCQQDISGLEISMENAVFVRMMNGASDRDHQFGGTPQREAGVVLLQLLSQIAAFNILHGEVELPLVFAGMENLDDMVMVEHGDRVDLDPEPLQERGLIRRPREGDHLERHDMLFVLPVMSTIDDPHAAPAEFFVQLIVSNDV
ncbi:MAG TPA: hypothetical protein VNM37_15435, partial [Candidatus Dormibacteraeota bacterium]|nr:hypothetical protein [Candidatus Dormibacteraeota bacterium]